MTTITADGLPPVCYGTHPTDGSLILLKAGESGYWPAEGYSMGPFATWSEVADLLNEKRGVTKAQRAAMETGSIMGWDLPGANPYRYDADGRFIPALVVGGR